MTSTARVEQHRVTQRTAVTMGSTAAEEPVGSCPFPHHVRGLTIGSALQGARGGARYRRKIALRSRGSSRYIQNVLLKLVPMTQCSEERDGQPCVEVSPMSQRPRLGERGAVPDSWSMESCNALETVCTLAGGSGVSTRDRLEVAIAPDRAPARLSGHAGHYTLNLGSLAVGRALESRSDLALEQSLHLRGGHE